ncbi:MAG TPA: DUF3046 domain-containing protein [Intrasporangiaceae bacterium]|nr:DUF3046 domain-containing protein [Intrasporangiaceae bacterium]
MWLSEFWTLMRDEFGDGPAQALANSHVLGALENRTATEALEAGIPPREVWLALVKDMDVPEERWWGKDLPSRP